MAAIPLIFITEDGNETQRGSLYDCPAEFFTTAQMKFYKACPTKWCICPLGYGVYSQFDTMGRKIVVPGIYLLGEKAPRRKFPDYQLKFRKEQIEQFLSPHLQIADDIQKARDREFATLTHDLRAISTEIYNAAYGAQTHLANERLGGVETLLDTVIAAQQMMSLRLDIIDYASGVLTNQPSEWIPVYKKTDKVYRCFKIRAEKDEVKIYLNGYSHDTTYGPPIFELIPFVIVENALKYAPKNSTINIDIGEGEEHIWIHFQSVGPKILPNEIVRIFDKDFRGVAAENSQKTGSGIGLYAARTLLEQFFGGTIVATQEDEALPNYSKGYYSTMFSISVPKVSRK